ncbi:acetyltransferase [Micromonospora rosaria]|uniref:Acetyltransferase n=2 Tax=Micromonospora TaxID=1873 RepID=A0A136PSS6_9ACTN|nr:GNAT family N-acetyltransferase [Micromonospora rosaria]KXK61488.1 acetyltransferase [Micromonospora rosaria]
MGYLVTDEPARRRFEILVDDALAGFTTYEPRGEVLVFTHTEVDPRFQDQGVGSALIRATLDQIRDRGGRIVVHCPFVAAFVDRHPEYRPLTTTP